MLLTFIKLPFVIKIFVLSIFEWLFYTGFMHQSFVSTIPPPTGMGGDSDFSLFRVLAYAPPCGDKLMVTTLLLGLPYTTEYLNGVSVTML